MSRNGLRVAIVGAGLGGLSAAIRLAAAGYEVDLFEARDGPGGMAGSERIGEYRFDTGPSFFTMPWVFEELFAESGASLDDYLKLIPLDPICRYFWSDGTRLQAYRDLERFAEEIERVFGEPRYHLRDYFAYTKRLYELADELFLEQPVHEARALLSKRFLCSFVRPRRIDFSRTMDRANGSYFTHPRVRQLFDRYATYNGSSPFRAPATLNIIPYIEPAGGTYAVKGGIEAVPRALEKRAREIGVRVHWNTPVERILYTKRRGARWRITGVRAAGEDWDYPLVVSNVDVTRTYLSLLLDESAAELRRYCRHEPSSSGLAFFWGITERFPQLGPHNIFFAEDYRVEFRKLFDELEMPLDPTICVNISARLSESRDAPGGHDNWFVLLNAPYENGQPWDRLVPRIRERVLRIVGEQLGVRLEEYIAAEGTMTPKDIESRTGSFRGSLYGISSNSAGAAFARHRNRSLRYDGLYFCGASAHPGGGMPLVLLSGKIVSKLIRRRSGRA